MNDLLLNFVFYDSLVLKSSDDGYNEQRRVSYEQQPSGAIIMPFDYQNVGSSPS